MAKNLRSAPRRNIEHLQINSVSSLANLSKIAKKAEIVEASSSGFLLIIRREDLVPSELRKNLTLESLVGTEILIYLPQMNLELSGKVVRTQLKGKKGFELGIDYTDDAPEYWRECLYDLLPAPGELD